MLHIYISPTNSHLPAAKQKPPKNKSHTTQKIKKKKKSLKKFMETRPARRLGQKQKTEKTEGATESVLSRMTPTFG